MRQRWLDFLFGEPRRTIKIFAVLLAIIGLIWPKSILVIFGNALTTLEPMFQPLGTLAALIIIIVIAWNMVKKKISK